MSGPSLDVGSSIPSRRARQACPSERISDGPTCWVGDLRFDDRSVFYRGLKSRVESGAKAPHSMECGDSSPLFSEGFSLHPPWQFQMFCREHGKRAPANDFSEGPACQVRRSMLDHPFLFTGHDKRAPPTLRRDLLVRSAYAPGSSIPSHRARQACHPEKISEGPACWVGDVRFDDRSVFYRGLKFRDESGAKAPHSMECGDSSPLFGEGFSLHRAGRRLGGPQRKNLAMEDFFGKLKMGPAVKFTNGVGW